MYLVSQDTLRDSAWAIVRWCVSGRECTVETLKKVKPLDPSLEVSPRTKMAEEDKGNRVNSSLRRWCILLLIVSGASNGVYIQ